MYSQREVIVYTSRALVSVRHLGTAVEPELLISRGNAYDILSDFQSALDKNKQAKAFFATLNSVNRYAILFRIHNAKKPETRARKIRAFVEMLERGEKIH